MRAIGSNRGSEFVKRGTSAGNDFKEINPWEGAGNLNTLGSSIASRVPSLTQILTHYPELRFQVPSTTLANREHAATAVCQGMARVRPSRQLSFAVLHHAGLSF